MSKCPEETVARFAPDLDEWLTEILGFSYDREAKPTPEDLILTMARHLMDPAFEAGVQAERERWEARNLIGVCSHDDRFWWEADHSRLCPESNPDCEPTFYRAALAVVSGDTGKEKR